MAVLSLWSLVLITTSQISAGGGIWRSPPPRPRRRSEGMGASGGEALSFMYSDPKPFRDLKRRIQGSYFSILHLL